MGWFNLVERRSVKLIEKAANILHKVITTIDAHDECLELLYQTWYMDDGVLAGKRSAVLSCTVPDQGAWPFTWLTGEHLIGKCRSVLLQECCEHVPQDS